MTTLAAKLSTHAQAELVELGRAAERASRGRPAPAEVGLKGRSPVAEDEVVVIVLSRHAALVSRVTVKGRALDVRELRRRLAGAEVAVERFVDAHRDVAPPRLARSEAAMLDEAGFVDATTEAGGALERSRIELDILLAESLTLEEAARALAVSTGRLRQRLGPTSRTLYGIKDGRAWRIPKFQFASKGKLVRGIERVLPRLRPDAHPLAVAAWFSTPHQDLVVGDREERVTPRAWLLAGRDPNVVAELAEEV
ncbi:MAG: hypothetical protein KIS78_17410 [Labilithrix sp.]|nr:hypothetical protein [Labilithrix sp.]